jgi:tRNA 2-selenouridine synthase
LSQAVDIEEFLRSSGPLFDVRSPCEFSHAHIPGSISLPLFTDEERAAVGITYKHSGHDVAVLKGLGYVGPKMADMARAIRKRAQKSGCCRVTCFRGGMRSISVAWLCEFLGFQTVRLEGGYKSFRRRVLSTFEEPWKLIILGGPTGSGKTEYLNRLDGKQVIDLEALANHRGSTFGLVPGDSQPSNEHFENLIALRLWEMDPKRPIFLEDESRLIGSCVIPKGLYEQMAVSPLFWLQVEREKRLKRIIALYGDLPRDWLVDRTECLKKRLGGQRTACITKSIREGRISEAADLLLSYYDAAYAMSRVRHPRSCIEITEKEFLDTAEEIV